MTSKTSDQETIWAIRDARTLNRNEKFFLMTVASRGVYRRSAKNAYAEMDMSRSLWEKTRDSLIDRSLLFVKRFPNRGPDTEPNHYMVNVAAVKALPREEQTEKVEPDTLDWSTGPDAFFLPDLNPVATEQNPVVEKHEPRCETALTPSSKNTNPVVVQTTKRTIKKTIEDDLEENQEEKGAPTALISQGIKEKDSSTSESSSGLIVNDPGSAVPDPLAVVVTPVGSPGAAAAAGFSEMQIRLEMHAVQAHQLASGIKQADDVIRYQAMARLRAKQKEALVTA